MRILALETAGRYGGVALLDADHLVSHAELGGGRRTAQSLLPTIALLLDAAGWKARDLQLIAVTQGPGSFTGLRLGVTAAKTLAYAVGAEVLGVHTLDAIAHQAPADVLAISVVLDAYRQQLFTKTYVRRPDGQLEVDQDTAVVEVEQWVQELSAQVAVTGPGLRQLRSQLPRTVTVVDEMFWTPQAVTVGQLAFWNFSAGRRDDYWNLVPHYFRPSAAEEKLTNAP